jgi:glucosamine-6-phosphate deaminase
VSPRVEVIPDDLWAERVAARFAATAAPGMRVCLAAGDTPRPAYGAIAAGRSLDGLTIFLLDEFGGLPEDDPGRCRAMLTRDLLDPSTGSPTVHSPEVDATEPGDAAGRYRDLIAAGGLDLAVVGLGANGHVGMNEPGSTIDMETRVVSLAGSTTLNAAGYGATELPTWGITVGMAELMDTTEVWLLVTGAHKRDILRRTLHGAVGSEVPATYLTEHPNCSFMVDESAGLTGPG